MRVLALSRRTLIWISRAACIYPLLTGAFGLIFFAGKTIALTDLLYILCIAILCLTPASLFAEPRYRIALATVIGLGLLAPILRGRENWQSTGDIYAQILQSIPLVLFSLVVVFSSFRYSQDESAKAGES